MRDILTLQDFPLAELSAMTLDGELVPVDRCFAPFDGFPTPSQRAGALGADLHDRLIAERGTAAWIWGARDTPPVPHEFCTAQDARIAHRSKPLVTIREVVLEDRDTLVVSEIRVTTPVRTVADIVRFTEEWSEKHRDTVARLLAIGKITLDDALQELGRHKLPHKRRAAERIVDATLVSLS